MREALSAHSLVQVCEPTVPCKGENESERLARSLARSSAALPCTIPARPSPRLSRFAHGLSMPRHHVHSPRTPCGQPLHGRPRPPESARGLLSLLPASCLVGKRAVVCAAASTEGASETRMGVETGQDVDGRRGQGQGTGACHVDPSSLSLSLSSQTMPAIPTPLLSLPLPPLHTHATRIRDRR